MRKKTQKRGFKRDKNKNCLNILRKNQVSRKTYFYKNLLNFLEKWSDLLYNLLIIQRSKDLCLEEEE